MESIRETIEKMNLRFSEMVRRGADAKELGASYTEDACVLPPNSDIMKGRKAVGEFWGGAISALGLKDIELKTLEVVGEGDTVTEMGRYRLKIEPKGQKPIEDMGKYVVLWKKTEQGWKLHWDIWNTSLPAQ